MFTKTTVKIILCLIFSVVIILILYGIYQATHNDKNGFTRKFVSEKIALTPVKHHNLKYYGYYIAGVADKNIYLGHRRVTSQLLVLDYDFSNIQPFDIPKANTGKLAWKALKTVVRYPDVYAIEPITPAILHTRFPSMNVKRYDSDIPRFSMALPMNKNSFVFRIYDRNLKQYILAKKSLHSSGTRYSPDILEKQVDGRFCTDGSLVFDPVSSRLVYMYYYRNEFIVADTTLQHIYKAHTIDTTGTARIEVVKTGSEKITTSTLAAPPYIVNKRLSVGNNYIYIQSNLKADNEDRETFETSSAIDVYSLKNGKYRFSFYLPDYMGKKLTDFKVFNQTLVALHGNRILIYRLNV